MSFTVFLGNLPTWVTADDIKSWLLAENLVADSIKVIRDKETQESKGFAFIDAPNAEEMQAIIRRFHHAPLEDRLLRANPAQPPRAKGGPGPAAMAPRGSSPAAAAAATAAPRPMDKNSTRRPKKNAKRGRDNQPQSAFAEELAKAL
jgi:RNA recognition motif-containing protein